MGKIKVLDNRLANMIAAGEVVERPSSVIKELVENSIDAGSQNINVYVYDAGRKKIIVEDDGCGMDEDDALLAFKRHATSKLASSLDLFRIRTLGFRGEALPSIASVSKMLFTTSTGVNKGTELSIENEEITKNDAPLKKGTTISVEELFYNTPARLKYLKSDFTENANNIEVMCRLALAHPEISFKLAIDGKEQFKTTGRGDLLEVIASIYGYNVAKNMIPFQAEANDFKVTGFLGKPELAKASRYYMITLLNGRNVNMIKVQNAIADSYHDFIAPGKYPFVILNLNIDFSLVDVNVHPSKKEVRFSKEEELRLLLMEKIPQQLRPSLLFESEIVSSKKVFSEPSIEQREEPAPALFINEKEEIFNDLLFEISDNKETEAKEQITEEIKIDKQSPIKAVAQLKKSFIIGEGLDEDDGFYLIDQHAAMERVNYEYYQKILNEEIHIMSPLIPQVLNFHPSDMLLFNEDRREILRQFGLEFEPFGPNAYKVVSLPTWIPRNDEQNIVEDLLNQVLHEDRVDINKLRKHAIATMACKASLKANMSLSQGEMNILLNRLFMCENPHNCPHGRPIIVRFTKYELDKMFKRTGL